MGSCTDLVDLQVVELNEHNERELSISRGKEDVMDMFTIHDEMIQILTSENIVILQPFPVVETTNVGIAAIAYDIIQLSQVAK